MIVQIIGGVVVFYIGTLVGRQMRTKQIDQKIANLHRLVDEVKQKNNHMVENIAMLYANSDHDQTKFTEVDEMLLNMWIS